jgi:hypothetical protein
MDYWMIRTFDRAGYYETRLVLMAICLVIACYYAYYKPDRRFLLMFGFGAVMQTVIEYILQVGGLRAGGTAVSLFGARMPVWLGPFVQGFTEGGSLAMFAFWVADLRSAHAKLKRWVPLIALGAVIVALSFAAGWTARNQPISSARPMFASLSIFAVTSIIFLSLFIAWRKNALPALANYYAGLLIFAILNYEPLHLLGARYIGVISHVSTGLQNTVQFVATPMPAQIFLMLLSHLYEAAGGKLHYFVIPLVLGLVSLKGREDGVKRERYSTQHLQDLAQRGWRKKSKPFLQ